MNRSTSPQTFQPVVGEQAHRAGARHIGTHVIADFWGCTYDESGADLVRLLTEAAEIANSEVISSSSYEFETPGTTAVVLLKESHMSLHTWPAEDYVAVDLFTCGATMRPEEALEYLESCLRPSRRQVTILQRGQS
jgi:S-adenosylmethionine decarboxylase